MTLPNATTEALLSANDFYLMYVRPGPGGYVTSVSIASFLRNGPPVHRDGTPLILPRTRLYSDDDLCFGETATAVEYGINTYEQEYVEGVPPGSLTETDYQELRETFDPMVAQNTLYDAVEAREEGIKALIQEGDFSFLLGDGPPDEDWRE